MKTGLSRIAIALALILATAQVAAQNEQGADEMSGLSFLSGCWKGAFGGGAGTIEEFYTAPSKNLILGATRYLREGNTVQYEFTRIESTAQGIAMTPYPNGRPSQHSFLLTSLTSGRAVFEAPEHDYPKRIIYRTSPEEGLTARIDGGADDPKPRQWRLSPAPCGPSPKSQH